MIGLKHILRSESIWYPTKLFTEKKIEVGLPLSRLSKCYASSKVTGTKLFVSEFGDPPTVVKKESLILEGSPSEGEVFVRMLTAAINPADLNTIQGVYGIKPSLPFVPGNEGVGYVEQVGSGVTNIKKGDWVLPKTGTWQTHGFFQQKDLTKIPNDIDLAFASTIAVNPPTAYRMLNDYVTLQSGDTVIQNGSNSAVGQSVIQFCKARGVNSVNIVRDRPEVSKLKEYLTSIGATYVLTEEELRSTDIFKSKQLKSPLLGFNCVGGKSASELIRHLGHGGTLVTYGGMSRQPVLVGTAALIFKDIRVVGYWMSRWKKDHDGQKAVDDMYLEIANLAKKGVLKTPLIEFVNVNNYETALKKATDVQGYTGKKFVIKFDN